MYKRVDHIEEENLDWDQSQKENIIFSPAYKNRKTLLENINTLDIEKRSMHFMNNNIGISSFIGVLFLPYFVGFLLTYILFYNYGNMTFIGFLNMDKEFLILQLWSIGAYLFVTTWVFWACSHIVKSSRFYR